MLTLVASICLIQPYFPKLVDFGFCMDFGVQAFVFTLVKAAVIYDALRHDSAFWQCETPETAPIESERRFKRKGGMAKSTVAGKAVLEEGFALAYENI